MKNDDRKMIFCGEWLDVLCCYDEKPDKQIRLFKEILKYGLGMSENCNIDDDLKPVFISIKSSIDRMNNKYKSLCSLRSEAGKKGMQARWKKVKYTEEQEKIFENILSQWNDITNVTRIRTLTEERKANIANILTTFSVDDFKTTFQNINISNFLKGHNQESWQITFDWLVKDLTNFTKVLENQYQNREKTNENQKDVNEIWK